jgi:hypothetical protein
MLRMESMRKGAKDERTGDRLAAAFRRWEQAAVLGSLDRIYPHQFPALAQCSRSMLCSRLRELAVNREQKRPYRPGP